MKCGVKGEVQPEPGRGSTLIFTQSAGEQKIECRTSIAEFRFRSTCRFYNFCENQHNQLEIKRNKKYRITNNRIRK